MYKKEVNNRIGAQRTADHFLKPSNPNGSTHVKFSSSFTVRRVRVMSRVAKGTLALAEVILLSFLPHVAILPVPMTALPSCSHCIALFSSPSIYFFGIL